MPLVHMAGGRRQPHRLQRPDAADAEDDLLGDAHLRIAAVQPAREFAVAWDVRLNVGVEEVERYLADLESPDFGDGGAPVERDVDAQPRAIGEAHRFQRLERRVDGPVLFLLPAVRAEPLVEVAEVVQQPHAHEWDAKIRGGLQVVAGENTEASGVVREALGERELK